MVTTSMMSTKAATLGLPKVKIFSNKSCDVITSVYDVTNIIFLRHSNHIVDVVMWQKFCNSSISMREVITTLEQSCFNNLGLAPDMALKFYTKGAKRVKTKTQKAFGANSYVCRSYRGKTSRETFLSPSPSVRNRFKKLNFARLFSLKFSSNAPWCSPVNCRKELRQVGFLCISGTTNVPHNF